MPWFVWTQHLPAVAIPDNSIPRRSGNVNLYLKFGTRTPTVLNLIMYAEFQNHLEIDRNRRVVYDLSLGA